MRRSLGIPLVLAVALSGCGGGGGSVAGALPKPGGKAPSAASATFTIVRPAAPTTVASSAKHPQFIPASAQSIRIHIVSVNGAPPDPFFTDVVVALSTLNPACTTLSNGGLSCSISAKVPVAASVVIQVSVYSSTDGSGSSIAVVTVPPIDTTQTTIVVPPISLGGVPAHILTSVPSISSPADGTTQTLSFNVWATDANNEIIVPPGNYPSPITATIAGDTNGSLTVPAPIVSPGPTAGQSQVSVPYNSAKALISATITLTSGTITNSVTVNPLNYSPLNLNALFAGGSSTSVSVSEAGYGGAFTLGGNGTNFTTSCIPASCTPSSAGGTVTIMVTPVSNGTGTFTIKDSNAVTASVPFVVTGQTSGSINVSQYKIYQYTPPSPAGFHANDLTAGVDGKHLWFTDTSNSAVVELDTTSCNTTALTCTMDAKSETSGVYGIAAGADGNIYVSAAPFNIATAQGVIQIMSSTGCSNSSCATNTLSFYNATSTGGEMVRAYNGQMLMLDTATGANNIVNFGANASSPLYDLFLSSSATGNYAFIAAGPGGATYLAYQGLPNIAWTDNGTQQVAMETCNPSDCTPTPVEFSGFNPGNLNGLVFAPDGNIYVSEGNGNGIGKFAPGSCGTPTAGQCVVTHISVPTSSPGITGMAIGPDGNVWFTEETADKIGILNITTGNVSEIPIPGGGVGVNGPRSITLGPDGNMWYTDYTSGKIGEVVL